MKELINEVIYAIRDDSITQCLLGFPAKERDKIISAIKHEFKSEVRVIKHAIPWKDIKIYKEKIIILMNTDKIINTHSLGEDFRSMLHSGSIYLLFSHNKISDFSLHQHWDNFKKGLDRNLIYKYKKTGKVRITNSRLKVTDDRKSENRKISSAINQIIFFIVLLLYLSQSGVKEKNMGHHNLFLLVFFTLNTANLFWGISIEELLKNKLEPFIYDKLNHIRSQEYPAIRYCKVFANGIKSLISSKKADRDVNEE